MARSSPMAQPMLFYLRIPPGEDTDKREREGWLKRVHGAMIISSHNSRCQFQRNSKNAMEETLP